MNNTNIRSNSLYAVRSFAWLACIAFLSACQSDPSLTGSPDPLMINIDYTNGCPVAGDVSVPLAHIVRGQKIYWQSIDTSSGSPVPVSKDYEIIFDPFVGTPIKSGNRGLAKSKPVGSNKPEVEYKYTIDTDGCATALDPRIIVH